MPIVAALAGPPPQVALSAAALPPSSRRLSLSSGIAVSASSSPASFAPDQSIEAQPAPREFHYTRADPSVRWPNLKLDDFSSKPQILPSPSQPLPSHFAEDDSSSKPAEAGELEPFEPLEGKHSRTRAKKMTKLALKRARDWRQRVQLLADRILALPPSAHVADVLDNRGGLQMTPTDLAFVVKVVGRSSWARALETFEWLTLRRSHAPGPRLVSIIISILGRANQDSLAAEIFQRCCNLDANDNIDGDSGISLQVYNAMMGVYARSGKFSKVQELLALMKDKGFEPDLVSFNTLINAKAKAGALAPGSALELLKEVRRSGLRPDTITYNTLISACSHGSNLDDAVRIFRDMEASRCQPDLWTYNAMVSVFGRCGMAQDALSLFNELRERGFTPDAVTYNSLLYSFAKEGDVNKVEKVCNDMLTAGFKKDEITYNILIHMYGKQARLDIAVQLYEEMKAAGCHPDSVTYTVLIDSLGKADRIMDAGKILSEMVNAGVRPTLRTFSALICGYGKAGMRVEAESTFDHMLRSGIKPDHLAYSVMLDILLRSNDIRKAMSMYKGMMRDGFRPDEGTYQAIFSVHAKANENEKIEDVIKDMEEVCMMSPQVISTVLIKGDCFLQGANILKKAVKGGYEPDHEKLLSLVEAYSAANKLTEALDLIEFLQEHAPNSSTVTMEASIITLCKAHRLESAMTEYNKMKMLNFGPFCRSYSLYQQMITSLLESGLFSEASQLFSDMNFLRVKPSEAIYKSMISVYCNMGFPETAECLVGQAERTGIMFADLASYVCLIETYGKLKLWQKAETFVRRLNQHSIIDKKILNALIYAYAESGQYEQARAVFNMMVKNGPSPTVDSVNGLMHALIVDDRLDELFVVVEELQDMNFKICKSTILIMLDAFARAGNIFEVKKIYNGMKAAGYLPTMNLYRIMISLFCRGKRVRDVESMVAEMQEAGFKPDLLIYNSLLKMYTKIEDFKKTVEVYQRIRETGHEADEDTYNTLIVMCSKDLRPEEGFTILNEMKEKGLEPRLDTYKSLLSACYKAQLWEQAEELFNSMQSKGYKLDRSFYHIMMKIYRNSGNHSKAENLLFIMEGEGIRPTVATMHLLMVSYGSAGQPHEAENVLNNLKTSGLQLTTLPYSSLIDAYLKVGDYNMGVTKLQDMKRDGVEPDHKIWTCFIRAASLCERTDDAIFLLNSIGGIGFDLPIRLLNERTDALILEVDRLLEELKPLRDDAAFNFVNALEDLLWAFEHRATASWLFKLAIQKCVYCHDVFRVAEKDWGADFRKLSAGAALVGLTLWLDHMQDASLQGSPESPKSVVLITGTAEYNMVSLNNTIKAFLWEMGSPFLPCKTRSGILVAKAHSLRMWLKDSSFCLDLELKDAISLPEANTMKLTEGYFMRAGLVPAFKDIHERLGQIRPKKFARLALLSDESRDKVIKADIGGRKEKLEKLNKKIAMRARRPTRLSTGKFMRRQHNAAAN